MQGLRRVLKLKLPEFHKILCSVLKFCGSFLVIVLNYAYLLWSQGEAFLMNQTHTHRLVFHFVPKEQCIPQLSLK